MKKHQNKTSGQSLQQHHNLVSPGQEVQGNQPDSYLRGIGRILKCAQSNTL